MIGGIKRHAPAPRVPRKQPNPSAANTFRHDLPASVRSPDLPASQHVATPIQGAVHTAPAPSTPDVRSDTRGDSSGCGCFRALCLALYDPESESFAAVE
jgi:hypothetical protein